MLLTLIGVSNRLDFLSSAWRLLLPEVPSVMPVGAGPTLLFRKSIIIMQLVAYSGGGATRLANRDHAYSHTPTGVRYFGVCAATAPNVRRSF